MKFLWLKTYKEKIWKYQRRQSISKSNRKNGYTHETLSKIVGKSRSHITNLMRILELDNFFFDLLNSGIISMGHARALIGKTPNDFDDGTIKQIASGKISVRDLEKIEGK